MRRTCVSLVAPARALAAGARRRSTAAFAALLLLFAATLFGTQSLYAQTTPPCTQEFWCGMGLYPSSSLEGQPALEGQGALNAVAIDAPEEAIPLSEEATSDFALQTLVFQSLRDGNWEIYKSRLDGYGRTRLTYNAEVDSDPRLSPTMQNIAFVSDRDAPGIPNIYVMNLDGSDVRRLTWEWGATAPRWTPDGANVYFTAWKVDAAGKVVDYDIKRVRIADGAVQTIVGGATVDFDVALNVDGSEIVWVRPVDAQNGVLMRAKPDGSDAYAFGEPYRFLGKPAWSPGGNYLSFETATGEGWNSLYAHAFVNDLGQVDGTIRVVPLLIGGERVAGQVYVEYTGNSWTHSYITSGDFYDTDDRLLYTEYRYQTVFEEVMLQRRMALGHFYEMGGHMIDELRYLSETQNDSSPNARWTDATAPTTATYRLAPLTQAGSTLRWLNRDAGGSGLLRAEIQLSATPCCKWEYMRNNTPTDFLELCLYNDFTPQPPHTLNPPFYRIRLLDRALNASAWTTPVSTICYFDAIRTLVTDVRGKPIAGVRFGDADAQPVGLSTQQPSDSHGVIRGYSWWDWDAGQRVFHPAYGMTTGGWHYGLSGDIVQASTYYVSPAGPDLIQDGGFDKASDSSPWQWQAASPGEDYFSGNAAHIWGNDASPSAGSISQTIAASTDWETMINPTLAFAWRFASSALVPAQANPAFDEIAPQPAGIEGPASGSQGGPYVEVLVRDTTTLSETVVLRHNGAITDWRISWVDMTPWQGKPIEVIFAMRNPGNAAAEVFAIFDNVSLSPWRTPMISEVTPTAVDAPAAATITITGTNLIGKPTVQLLRSTAATAGTPLAADDLATDDLAAPDEVVLDPASVIRNGDTLTAALPANLAPGLYHILVINPGGDRSFAPQTLTVGDPVYLPRIGR